MDDRQDIITRNRELLWQLNEELLRDPNHPYTGKWIGIANGQIVCVGDTREEVKKRLDDIEPDSFRRFCVEGVAVTEWEV
ncbi:MAG TPA: DUF5678 domain-containing protein [Gemmataceae bacterium]|nr:DUF5678 domain-containing protein [Gemmataceae bacterium]